MTKIFRGSGLKLDSPLLQELYEQREREEEKPHNWETDNLLEGVLRIFHRHINNQFLGTDDKILKERQKIALETKQAFDSPAYITCPEHQEAEVSLIRDKGTNYFFCEDCTKNKIQWKIDGIKGCIRVHNEALEEYHSRRKNSIGASSASMWDHQIRLREGSRNAWVNEFGPYKNALKTRDYREMLVEIDIIKKLAFECPTCELIVPGKPLSYDLGEHKTIYLCEVCERQI